MRHLIVCRDYPPARAGGIGVYTWNISRLLVEAGETVHVVAQQWRGADKVIEKQFDGKLIIHRIPFFSWKSEGTAPHESLNSEVKLMHESCPSPALLFGWQAIGLIERLVDEEQIDLIESSEYEAPLYHFMLRRALGLGPRRQPPCLIHLHSPTELLSQFNDEDILAPFRLYAIRHENYCIASADAWLCPSEAMKQWAVSRYGLESAAVNVIPLPVGHVAIQPRTEDVWKHGTIAFTGRLQPCKGVIEFVTAAVEIAKSNPDVIFDLYGSDTAYLAARNRSMQSILKGMIPADLRGRFRFHGLLKRDEMLQRLSQSRIGIVPSRWETFSNSCIELMASGLPVVGMPNGAIPEIIEDGKTGWLAKDADAASLAEALNAAISTGADRLREMGQAAVWNIQNLCNNGQIVQQHLELRKSIAGNAACHSIALPATLSRSSSNGHRSSSKDTSGIAIAIPCYNQGGYLRDCLHSIKQQTMAPVKVIIVNDGSDDEATLRHLEEIEREGWTVLHKKNGGLVSARNAGIQVILDSGMRPLGIICIDSDDRLRPDFVLRCENVLKACPDVGVVSTWIKHFESADRIWMKPCPSFPYQWTTNEIATFSAVRTEALVEVGLYQLEMHQGCYSDWDLFNAVLAAGWKGVTIPEVLGEYRVRDDSILRRLNAHAHGRMRRAMFERFADLVAADAIDVALLSEAADSWVLREEVFTLRAQVARARSFFKRPDRAVRWFGGKIYRRAARVVSRLTSKPI